MQTYGVGEVDTRTLGSYSISYTYRSAMERPLFHSTVRLLYVTPLLKFITLNGAEPVVVALGDTFVDGASAWIA